MLGEPIEAHMHVKQLKPPVSKNKERTSSEQGGAGRTVSLPFTVCCFCLGGSWGGWEVGVNEWRKEERRRGGEGRPGGGAGASLRTEEEVPRASSDSDIKAPFQQRKSHVYAPSVSSHTCNIFTFSFTLTCAVIGRGRSNRSSLHAALGVQSFFHSPSFSQQIVFFFPPACGLSGQHQYGLQEESAGGSIGVNTKRKKKLPM